MEVRSAIAKLTEDLQHFKSIIRNLNETNQQEALNVLDAVIASDRVMQQAISKEIDNQKALQQIQATKKAIGALNSEVQTFSEEIFDKLCDLETDLETDKEYLNTLQLRMKNAEWLKEENVLKSASMLAHTMGPPLGWTAGASLRMNRPPYPTEDLMRSSFLFRKMNLNESAMVIDGTPKLEFDGQQATSGHPRRSSIHESHQLSFDIMDLDLNPDLS